MSRLVYPYTDLDTTTTNVTHNCMTYHCVQLCMCYCVYFTHARIHAQTHFRIESLSDEPSISSLAVMAGFPVRVWAYSGSTSLSRLMDTSWWLSRSQALQVWKKRYYIKFTLNFSFNGLAWHHFYKVGVSYSSNIASPWLSTCLIDQLTITMHLTLN